MTQAGHCAIIAQRFLALKPMRSAVVLFGIASQLGQLPPASQPTQVQSEPVQAEGCQADHDGDGDVDLTDYYFFDSCNMGGPDQEPPPHCFCSDIDGDGDVDLLDFAEFQVLFTGSRE